ncbi:amino acid adenylation domain-containing protein [Sorangium sp. So ce315]|uniref:type I polyketide synthase n=1 Tax=Sorangium sp. So ce315 TaxID=3133299 RepID=UPI003F5DAA70
MSSPDDGFAIEGVAVIGIGCRFPKSRNADEFWENLRRGLDAVSTFTEDELLTAGVAPSTLAQPSYVRARGALEGTADFDAEFFDFTPREAELTDPQHRLFLEWAWEALEDAGYDAQRYPGRIGVFGGASMSTYLLGALARSGGAPEGLLKLAIGGLSDFLATRLAYKLDLRGPSVSVQTACSTSLVAVHMACMHLLAGQCDLALAGGVSIRAQEVAGYLYQEGGIFAPDGKCRAFDARAGGTVEGSGGGLVALKRLEDALEDGDHIRAVIRATAINNDGSHKVGFTAPSVRGQAEVIALAHALAGVSADTIGYVEAHGTGTPLGDPIEIAALREAFARTTSRKRFCAIGSVKTSIGHLDTAAGVAGLIKSVLVLEHKEIPPSLHFEQPNPQIDFDGAPVYVNARLAPWPADGTPRRAGVSSFGIGGTNAHAVLEEAPPRPPAGDAAGPSLLTLSARTATALRAAANNLAAHLERRPEQPLADVAFTLQVGRRQMPHRLALVCESREEAISALAGEPAGAVAEPGGRGVVLLFSGQGTQYVGMGGVLFEREPTFRAELERCAQLFRPHLKADLLGTLYPPARDREQAEARLARTAMAQPALFAVEYALARMWQAWGVRPCAMAGHSLGEYVAACIAGVFSLEDAVAIVSARGALMEAMPRGSMLAVPLAERELAPLLGPRLSLAAVNGPSRCVASGPPDAVDALKARLAERGVQGRPLHTSHAFHSPMMEPAIAPFLEVLSRARLVAPELPLLSNVTGDYLSADDAADPRYWARHLLGTVRFDRNLGKALERRGAALLEVGPGRVLSTLARQHPACDPGRVIVASLRRAGEQVDDEVLALRALGQLWQRGVDVDWQRVHRGPRRRLPLPTYPFERKRYWLDDVVAAAPRPTSPADAAPGAAPPAAAPSRAPRHDRPDLGVAFVAPRSEIERRVSAIWQDCLGFARVGVNDGFFDLGGDSLLATQVLSRLRGELDVEAPVRAIFEHDTVAKLAAYIETRPRAAAAAQTGIQPASREGELPLSSSQQRLWTLEQITPGSVYNLPQCVRLKGALDVEALEATFADLVRRHESLRTTFHATGRRPHQIVAPPAPLPVRKVDLRALPEPAREEAAARLATEEVEQPFDLASGPLVRVTLVRLADDEQLLVMVMHHIASDGWSMRILASEMEALYAAHRRGEPAGLPPLPIQYADYARWQRERVEGPALKPHIDWWKAQLDGIEPLELPLDKPRPTAPSLRSAEHRVAISRELSEALEAMCQRENVTPFMALLAVFSLVLGRHGGQSDVAVGSPVANRGHKEVEGLIGCFVNTIVLRTRLEDVASARHLLGRVREAALGAYAHQELPFEVLVDALQPARELGRAPLFQAMFSLQGEPVAPHTFEGIEVRFQEISAQTTQFDVTLWLERGAEGFAGALVYAAELFDARTAARLARDFARALERLVQDPSCPLDHLVPLDADDARKLAAWSAGERRPVEALLVHELFLRAARRQPGAVALVGERESLTYAQLEQRASRLTRHLRARGFGPEARAVVYLERSVEAVVALLSVLMAGGAYVPVPPSAACKRLQAMLDEVAPRVVVTRAALAADLPGGIPVICVDAPEPGAAPAVSPPPASKVRPDNVAYALFTSGSTGRPKCVEVPHGALANHVHAIVDRYGVGPGDSVLHFASLAFDVAAEEIFPTLASGATLVLRPDAPAETVADLLAFVERNQVSVVNLPAAYWHEWVDELPTLSCPLPPSVRLVVAGSEAVSASRLARWRERIGARVQWLNAYGPTEATITASVFDPATSGHEPVDRVPIGRPLANVRMYVLDATLRPVPPGAVGELYLGGAGLSRGYLAQPSATAAAFLPDPFADEPGARMYRTGDRARFLADGNLEFLGRRDHQIKLRGHRVELDEIEAAIEQIEGVREAAVVYRANAAEGPQLEAHVVPVPGDAPGVDELRGRLGLRLPAYMMPSRFAWLESLPRLPSGKVDRRALAPIGPASAGVLVAPRTPAERALADVWSDVLGRAPTSIHDSFFDSGGDSMLAVRLVSRAKQAGLQLSVRDVFQHQTIAQIAAVAARPDAEPTPAPDTPPPAVGGPLPLLPTQQRLLELRLPAPHHWNRSLLVETPERLDPGLLARALHHLLVRHDALRARFSPGEHGFKVLDAGSAHDDALVSRVDLSAVREPEQRAVLEAAVARLQTSLDLSRGPLLRLAWLDLGPKRAGRLLIIIHALVADGISWSILLDELQTAYLQVRRGESIRLPGVPTSLRDWVGALAQYARSDALLSERDAWLALLEGDAARLPFDRPGGQNDEGSTQRVVFTLDRADTQRLLHHVVASLGSGVESVLLAPVARVLNAYAGGPVLVDVGRLGREDPIGKLDLTRTVGCLVADCPVRLDVRSARDARSAVVAVDATLSRVPGRGLGHGALRCLGPDDALTRRLRATPRPEVSFDYLSGRVLSESALFKQADESTGAERDPRSPRSHVFQVVCSVVDGSLRVEWRYSERLHGRATVERLVASCAHDLRALLEGTPPGAAREGRAERR